MKGISRALRSLVLYLLTFLFGALAGFYLSFPADILKNYINTRQDVFKIEDIKLIFPMGLKLSDITVSLPEKDKFGLKEVRITSSPSLPFTLPFGRGGLSVSVRAPHSEFKAHLTFLRKEQKLTLNSVSVTGKIALEDFPVIQKVRGRGRININIHLSSLERMEISSGKFNMFSDKLTLHVSGLEFLEGEIKLGETELIGTMSSGTINVVKMQTRGGDIEGMATGRIKLNRRIEESELELVVDLSSKVMDIPTQRFKIVGKMKEVRISTL